MCCRLIRAFIAMALGAVWSLSSLTANAATSGGASEIEPPLNAETQMIMKEHAQMWEAFVKTCPYNFTNMVTAQEVAVFRDCLATKFWPRLLDKHHHEYKVTIESKLIAGVKTEIISPSMGIAAGNRQRVLINVHGGSFAVGGRWIGQLESIPVAATGKIRIVSIDYRMAPEYKFPAASDDVLAVYRALLKEYRPANIGIYGTSAGATLTAEVVALMTKEKVPLPGAIGMFCAAAWPLASGKELAKGTYGYFQESDASNPAAFPGLAPETMKQFPDSLLISATGDGGINNVVRTHSQLVALGVSTDLHVWEGLDHAFFYYADFPESRQVYDVIAYFFDKHLGKHDMAVVPRKAG